MPRGDLLSCIRAYCFMPLFLLAALAPIHSTLSVAQDSDAVHRSEPEPTPETPGESKVFGNRDPEAIREEMYSVRPERVRLGGFGTRAPRFGRNWGPSFMEAVSAALNIGSDGSGLMTMDWTKKILELEHDSAKLFFLRGLEVEAEGNVRFNLDQALVLTERASLNEETGEVLLERDVSITRGDSFLTADRILYRRPEIEVLNRPVPLIPRGEGLQAPHVLVPHGSKEDGLGRRPTGTLAVEGLRWNEPNRVLRAESMSYDFGNLEGELINVSGNLGPMYFGAKRLRILGPADILGEEIWVTTCDRPVPHYRIRLSRASLANGDAYAVKHARLHLGKSPTPLYIPMVRGSVTHEGKRLSTDIDLGNRSELGLFLNIAPWFQVTPDIQLAPRVYATTSEGIGFGLDGEYDFLDDPASILFGGRGSFQTMYTTRDSGYTQFYHRQEISENTVMLAQFEQWFEPDFVKDFYDDIFEDRTGPRSFINLTHTRPQQMASLTVSKATHDFTTETEKLPEATYHLFERRLGKGFYGTFDGAAGHYRTAPDDLESGRITTQGRLTYDLNVAKGINLTPFIEGDGAWYSKALDDDESSFRASAIGGVTLQTRFQRAYAGLRGYSGFKHIVVPSVTYTYRPDASLAQDDTPRFDALDDRQGRSRIESSISSILLGRNAKTGETWPVARLGLFQGHDFSSEGPESDDYEVQMQVRPRPWWGFQTTVEYHEADGDEVLPEENLDRVLSFLFFDNRFGKNTMNARLGYAVTETDAEIFNREILYGFGYKLTGNWSFSAEHRYDIELAKLTRQTYEIRRRLHKWEIALRIRERSSGLDIGIAFNLTDFPGAKLSF